LATGPKKLVKVSLLLLLLLLRKWTFHEKEHLAVFSCPLAEEFLPSAEGQKKETGRQHDSMAEHSVVRKQAIKQARLSL
jgi:hypothetical protein